MNKEKFLISKRKLKKMKFGSPKKWYLIWIKVNEKMFRQ